MSAAPPGELSAHGHQEGDHFGDDGECGEKGKLAIKPACGVVPSKQGGEPRERDRAKRGQGGAEVELSARCVTFIHRSYSSIAVRRRRARSVDALRARTIFEGEKGAARPSS
jgi:hypothetical protein